MRNDTLEKALEETWKNKEKFYESTKDLSMLEIIKKIESRHLRKHGGIERAKGREQSYQGRQALS